MITAMTALTIFLILAAILAGLLLGRYLVDIIKGDGYGDRGTRLEPPRSHHRDFFDPSAGPTRLA